MMSGLHTLHPGGRLYEIDTRLRPSGSRGLLVSTIAAWKLYHQQSARLWERQALTKLRAIAGDEELGKEARAIAESCIYQDHEHEPRATAEGIAQGRNQIWSQLVAPQKRIDFKAGHGGLIDIEFAAQYLQLVHGGNSEGLRTTSTTEALATASELGLASVENCELLIEGYRFLRRLEHRLRIVHDRSEHHLPSDPVELEKLARRIGYPDGPQLVEDYQRWSRDVHDAYVQVLGL
jgi:glutamate-ammonia-ligase adenylyltransferase